MAQALKGSGTSHLCGHLQRDRQEVRECMLHASAGSGNSDCRMVNARNKWRNVTSLDADWNAWLTQIHTLVRIYKESCAEAWTQVQIHSHKHLF